MAMRSLKNGIKIFLEEELANMGFKNTFLHFAEMSRNDTDTTYPICGSILNGAQVMFAMPQFEENMIVTKSDYAEGLRRKQNPIYKAFY